MTTITINKPPKQAHRVRKKLLATGLTVTTALTTGFAAADPITVVSRVGSYGAAQLKSLVEFAHERDLELEVW